MSEEMDEVGLGTVTPIPVAEAIKCISMLDNRTPGMMWGPPGCGKTRTLLDKFEREMGHVVIPVLAGQSEPTDLAGIPWNYNDQFAKYLVPWWGFLASTHPDVKDYKMLNDGTIAHDPDNKIGEDEGKRLDGPMVLFFDDIVTAHEQTQAAFYKVVDEKKIGDLQIRDNVRLVAAGNRLDDMSAVTDMPKALCNRFIHFYVREDIDSWIDWAATASIHPHVMFYLRQHQNRLSEFEEAKNSTEVHAWATPRTWEMVSRILFQLDEVNLRTHTSSSSAAIDFEFEMVQGCIGTLAHEFLAVVRDNYSIVPIEDILKDPMSAEVPELKEPDRLYATVCMLEHWFSKDANHKYYETYIKYMMRLPDDFAVLCARQYILMITQNKIADTISAEILDNELTWELVETWQDRINIPMDR